MRRVRTLVAVVIGIALVLLVVQNTATVQARFLWFTAEMPTILLLFLASAGGFILGLLVGFLTRSHGRPES